jgi:carbon monoxide dehydrogenase subunit G
MTRLERRFETRLGAQDAFDFIADFGNAMHWDPGVATSTRIGDAPTGVGSRSDLGVRMGSRVVPMEYTVTAFERPGRVVLEGAGKGVTASDEIRFTPSATGTTIDYIADIKLHGLLGLIQPLLGRQFDALARNAVEGMKATLDARAAAAPAAADPAPAVPAPASSDAAAPSDPSMPGGAA